LQYDAGSVRTQTILAPSWSGSAADDDWNTKLEHRECIARVRDRPQQHHQDWKTSATECHQHRSAV